MENSKVLMSMIEELEREIKNGNKVNLEQVNDIESMINQNNADDALGGLLKTKLLRLKKKVIRENSTISTKWELFVYDMNKLENVEDIMHLINRIDKRKDEQVPQEEVQLIDDEFRAVLPSINKNLSAYDSERAVREVGKRIKLFKNRLSRIIENDFGAWIKQLRLDQGYSLKELETISGVTASYIHRLETGARKTPSIPIAEKLATALGVPPDDFLKKLNLFTSSDDSEPLPLNEFIAVSKFKLGKEDKNIVTKEQKDKLLILLNAIIATPWTPEGKFNESMLLVSKIDDFKQSIKNLDDLVVTKESESAVTK